MDSREKNMRPETAAHNVFPGGTKALVGFISFLGAFTPLSTDMYMPALPSMAAALDCTPDLVTLTISLFILVFACSMFVWGPLSDKYGRKPVLFAGIAIYIASSVLCVFSTSITMLIAMRVLQAVGGGSVGAVSMAIIKDVFRGRLMETMLAVVQTVMIVAPVVAPVAGGFLLKFTSWKGIFVMLAACGALGLLGTFVMKETNVLKNSEGVLGTFKQIGIVLADKKFSWLLFILSFPSAGFMSYISASSYVYVNEFGMTPQVYSLYFALVSFVSMFWPMVYIRFLRGFDKAGLFTFVFAATLAVSFLIQLVGHANAYVFTFLCILLTASNVIRPPATTILMSIREGDNGITASLIGSFGLLCGGLGMLMCSLPWPDFVTAIAGINIFAVGLSTVLWLFIGRKML